MKNLNFFNRVFLLAGVLLMTACSLDPARTNHYVNSIEGAPEWVNIGSIMQGGESEPRIFRGVSSITLQGDMALQKSIANDQSFVETGKVLAAYLEQVSTAYLASPEAEDAILNDDSQGRSLESNASKRVREGVSKQIDDAISRQFKEEVSPQFKQDVYRRIRNSSRGKIKSTISMQIEFSQQLEEEIARQIKAAVSRQLLNTIGVNLKNAKIVESWRDPQTNFIWVLSELELSKVKPTMAEIKELNADLKNFFAGQAEAIFDRILKDARDPSYFSLE